MLDWMPDKQYLSVMYRGLMGKKLNVIKPATFNEKLQWLKLHDRKPEYTTMVDKYAVKKYVEQILGGGEYIIPTLGVWNEFDDIDFSTLPDCFVLKCTHDSGGIAICKDKEQFDYSDARNRIIRSLKCNYYSHGREWPYKDVPPQVIAEEYLGDSLNDYKFFCFNGKVKCFKIDFDRFTNHHANYYDCNGDILPFGEADYIPIPEKKIEMPKKLGLMIELAEKLASKLLFLRVDFYEVNGKVYFGELTFYPASGMGRFVPESWDTELGKWLKLPIE